tara:strand:+ start:1429 stop:3039 length:1611 start_codon:yes stop_codon:yes gene_type:complete
MIGFDLEGNVMGGPGNLGDEGADINSSNVLNVSPTTSVKKAGLYDPKNPAKAATHEGLYANRKDAMKAAGVTFGTQGYKDWDAKTRALMGVNEGDKFSSGQWMETFGGMSPSQINAYEGDAYLSPATKMGMNKFKQDASSIMSGVSIPGSGVTKSMTQFYLDDEPAVSGWANQAIGGYKNQKGIPSYGYMTDEQVAQKVLKEASKSGEMNPFMVAGLKMKRGKNLPANQIASIVGSTTGPQGSYNSGWDRTRMNYAIEDAEWGATPFHELAGHRLIGQLPDEFYDQQMPNVQALYETGGSQIAPDHVAPYGFDPSQGEMVTSRAAELRDLFELNAPIHEGSTGYRSGRDWDNFSDYMQKNRDISTRSRFAHSSKYNPNENLTNLEELGYNRQLARDYENYARFNQELFGRQLGGDPRSVFNTKQEMLDYGNVPAGEEFWAPARTQGLGNAPLISEHFLVDRLLARNPEMVGTEMESVIENEYNAAIASPESVINKLSRYGLAEEFWDKVEDYITAESEHWSPSRARAEIRNILGGQ